MRNRSDDTKRAILTAAIAEFSAFGIAGARVDRIAKAADANVSLLFRYFGNKSQLFDIAFETLAAESLDVVPFDPDDLPGYAGRLVDHYRENPEIVRLSAWYQLERQGDAMPPRVVDSERKKILALRASQASGRVTADISAEALLRIVLHIAISSTDATPVLSVVPLEPRTARESVVHAVHAAVKPR